MKRFLISIGLVLLLTVGASAQGFKYFGPTTKVQDARATPNTWWNTNPSGTTISSLELKGYDSVRVDYDISTGADVRVNLQCSNDSIWVSGDSITVDTDEWGTFDLMGCEDYNVYVESVSGGDTITIYMTPFND